MQYASSQDAAEPRWALRGSIDRLLVGHCYEFPHFFLGRDWPVSEPKWALITWSGLSLLRDPGRGDGPAELCGFLIDLVLPGQWVLKFPTNESLRSMGAIKTHITIEVLCFYFSITTSIRCSHICFHINTMQKWNVSFYNPACENGQGKMSRGPFVTDFSQSDAGHLEVTAYAYSSIPSMWFWLFFWEAWIGCRLKASSLWKEDLVSSYKHIHTLNILVCLRNGNFIPK